MNGERHLEYLETVRDLKALLDSRRPSGMDALVELGCYWAEFFKKLEAQQSEPEVVEPDHRARWARWGWSGMMLP